MGFGDRLRSRLRPLITGLLVHTLATGESQLKRRVRRILTGEPGRLKPRLVIAAGAALFVIACLGLPAARSRMTPGEAASVADENSEGEAMAVEPETLKYGFRHDPMGFVEDDETLQGALVRKHVFGEPNPGDEALLQAKIEEILAEQNEDGTLSDDPDHRYQFTCGALSELADLGVDPGREEVNRAVDVVLREKDEQSADPIGIYTIRALCQLGMSDRPEVKAGLEHLVAREEEWNGAYAGCPWTPIEHLQTLWIGRDVLDATELIQSALTWIADGMSDAGCLTYKDPWGFLRIAGFVHLPVAKRIVEQQVPMILRGQQADGGWGDRSLPVLRALVTHGALYDLRERPALPPDWRIVREIPAPGANLYTLTFDGENLWTRDCETDEAVRLSPADGGVLRRLKLPEGKNQGLGWWNGGLGVTQSDPKRLLKLNPETGEIIGEVPLEIMDWINGFAQVNGEVWVADGFQGNVLRLDAARPGEGRPYVLGGPIPADLAAVPDGVWHCDIWAPGIMKTSLEGRTPHDGHLIEWAEKPFDGRCDGLAWDGEDLWALDNTNKRVCIIERAH
jgi:hypothetical protein